MDFVNNLDSSVVQVKEPYFIQDGVFGASFNKNGETLFFRMELLTEANAKCWGYFKEMTCWVANQNSRGILSCLIKSAGKPNYPSYEKIKDRTGFTENEYIAFTEKAIAINVKTEGKIVKLLEANSEGSAHMCTYLQAGRLNYIVYVSKDAHFSIQKADMKDKEINLKNFIESYKDILISMGSDFSEGNSFHNRGISRNPYWVFEEKYSGLSMLLHAFTGAVADKHFPEKKQMHVRPLGSMQWIVKNNLLPGEGYIERNGEKIDITSLEVSKTDPECELTSITVLALKRLYA